MTKVKFILSSISSCLLLWFVNHTSMYVNSELNVFELNVFKDMKFVSEISNN